LPPVTVTTVRAQKRDFAVTLQGNGIVSALTSVDLRSQVTSTVVKLHFSEGQFVKAGQLLFTLDSRADEANLAKAGAQLVKDQASLADAKRQLERARQLFAQNFISQGAVDTAQTLVESAAASTVADQAAIDAARVTLSFDRIAAPLSGRAGAVNVSTGSLVQANTTPLVTITQLDPIGVTFGIPQRNLPDALSALKGGGAAVTAKLADGGGSYQGRLQFVDNTVSAVSGTVQVKAVFPNKEGKLWPGAFVDISQTVSTLRDATTIPQAAVVQGPRGTVVYVLEDGKARLQPIKVVYAEAGEAAVTGIKPGDSVVMDGKQNVRPGSPLVERAKDAKAAGPGAAPADASKPSASQAAGTSKP
jgi:RND family efflux transporter MFP subunit